MSVVCLPGEKEAKFFFAVTVAEMMLMWSKDPESGLTLPCISATYEDRSLKPTLKVLSAMAERGVEPQMFIGTTDVSLLFEFPDPDQALLRELLVMELGAKAGQVDTSNVVELVMTVEADFDRSTVDMFKEKSEGRDRLLFQVMTSLENGRVLLQEIFRTKQTDGVN